MLQPPATCSGHLLRPPAPATCHLLLLPATCSSIRHHPFPTGVTKAITRTGRMGRMRRMGRMCLQAHATCRPPVSWHPTTTAPPHTLYVWCTQIDPGKKGAVIGPGGRIINQIRDATQALNIQIDEDGNVEVGAPSATGTASAAGVERGCEAEG
eukprot:354939-Chlamydomonas_euryale.AAC.2